VGAKPTVLAVGLGPGREPTTEAPTTRARAHRRLAHRRSDQLARRSQIGVWPIGVFLKVFFFVRFIEAAIFQSARGSIGLDTVAPRE